MNSAAMATLHALAIGRYDAFVTIFLLDAILLHLEGSSFRHATALGIHYRSQRIG
jgi:hypothetical protein